MVAMFELLLSTNNKRLSNHYGACLASTACTTGGPKLEGIASPLVHHLGCNKQNTYISQELQQ
jgi:hypothetical protein